MKTIKIINQEEYEDKVLTKQVYKVRIDWPDGDNNELFFLSREEMQAMSKEIERVLSK